MRKRGRVILHENAGSGPPGPSEARVVVVGSGFAGGSFLRNLPPALRHPGETLLVDAGDEYVFAPLLHEVAVGRIHPDSVRSPVSPGGFRGDRLRAEATGLDLANRTLLTSGGPVAYEYLVLAPGSVSVPPPVEISEHFQTFWSLDDALTLRTSLDRAWRSSVLDRGSRTPLTVAIVGGGATGIELAAEVAALFEYLKMRTARRTAAPPRVVLLEASDRLVGWLEPFFHEAAMEELARLGVEVHLDTEVSAADASGIEIGGGHLPAEVRVWTAGGRSAPLVADLPGEHAAAGRAQVTDHLTLPGHPEVYVLGDGAAYEHPTLGDLPPTGSVAVQQGPFAARDLGRRLRSARRKPFDFFDRGYIVSLGPESGVATAVGVRLRGAAAQALYRSVLLYYTKSRRGRALTGADWAMERTLGRVGFDLRFQASGFGLQESKGG